jgi:hypothetical protein
MRHPKNPDQCYSYICNFIDNQKAYIKEGVLCDEQLLVDLIKLEDKIKKAFRQEMPLDEVEEKVLKPSLSRPPEFRAAN